MKNIITIILSLLFFNTIHTQELEADNFELKLELKKFTKNINFFSAELIKCYDDFNGFLPIQTLRDQKSTISYPSLIPMEIEILTGILGVVPGEIIPGANVGLAVTGLITGLLEKGWEEHNKEIENKRKEGLIDAQIESYLKNLSEVEAVKKRMGPFITRGDEPSDFEIEIENIYNNADANEKDEIYLNLVDINKELVKYPIFSKRGIAPTTIMKKLFYENYINQFPAKTKSGNNLHGTTGSLVGYIELDDHFNWVSQTIIPDVPSGWAIGGNLNMLFPELKLNPLKLKVIKVLLINSPYFNLKENKWTREVWPLTLDFDSKIPWVNRKQEDLGVGKLDLPESIRIYTQPSTESKHAQKFLAKYGTKYTKKMKYKNGDEIEFELWRINNLLFKKFTKIIPKEIKKMPLSIRKKFEK